MEKVNRLRYALPFIIATAVLASCQKEKTQSDQSVLVQNEVMTVSERIQVPEPPGSNTVSTTAAKNTNDYNTFYGPVVQMGNGHARSWINITRTDNKPLQIGIELTDGALENLPTDHTDFAASTFVLTLHQKAKAVTPFDHITLNWEVEGHPPAGIYTVPHFDMHFYKITVAQQMAITGVPGPAPASGYLPALYVIRGATVPQMGTHWLDPTSPELNPVLHPPFTHTFIYGSDNGHVHFLEPMITRQFLLDGTMVVRDIRQPLYFSPANTYYPEVYKIWKNEVNGRHYVALTNFVWH